MGLPLNFRNILNLFNIKDYNQYFTTAYTIDNNVSIFEDAIEGYNGDGQITLAELKHFMGLVNFPDYMAENFFNNADANNDGVLNTDELQNFFNSFDADGSNSLDWSEGINIYNSMSNINIPSSTSFTQYSTLMSTTQATFYSYDANQDSVADVNEYIYALEQMGVDDGGSTANKVIDLYDIDNNNLITYDEMLLQNIKWDTNQNGSIDFNDGEADVLMDTLPWYVKPQDSMSQIEQIVASLILYNDTDGDKKLNEEEFKNYMSKMSALPASMAEEMLAMYGSGNSFTFEAMVSAYRSFDSDNNDELSYEELLAFQNSFSEIKIDPNEVSETQYGAFYQAGAQAIKGYDSDGDGEISVKEYRAGIKQAISAYEQAGTEIPDSIGEHLAENFIRLFDMDKNGSVSVIEIINQYAKYDTNKDGQVTGGEFIDQQERMEDSRLWDNVNEEFIIPGDTDFDKELNETELKNVLTAKGLPQYIADDAITLFDMNEDGKLSRLELMEMFSRYDGSVVNVDYIEEQTGEQYLLYTGNANQVLDDHEKLKLYEDIAAADANGINYEIDPARAAQYEKLLNISEDLVATYDQYKDGVLTPEEYKNYFKELGLPAYLADLAIGAYNMSPDGSLDLFENVQMLLDYDENQNGVLEFHEEFKFYDDLTGVGLNITDENRIQYQRIYNNVKEFLSQYDINDQQQLNRDNSIQIDELEKYYREQGLPDDYANMVTEAYDVNGDGALDVIEWMKAYSDFDFDANGEINNGEQLAMFDHIAGTGLPEITDSDRYGTLEHTADSLISKLDVTDNDKKLNPEELKALMKQIGLPDYLAGEFVATYDLNADGGIDKMEWIKAATTYDRNENGITEFNEELELYSTITGANLIAITEDEIKQYSSIYNYLLSFFAQKDDTTDRILAPEELQDYFTELELPVSMAAQAVELYDINGDGGLDIYEWMKPHIEFDINKNGKLDFNELMGMNGVISDPDLPIDPYTMDVEQVQNLYNYSLNYIMAVDTEHDDKQISENELAKYFKTIGLSENIASAVMAAQDANGDGNLDLMEWLNTNLQFDKNHTGIMEFNEMMDLYQDATGVELNTTDSNIYQHQALFNYVVNTFKTADTSSNKKISAVELKTWLKDYYAMTEDSANKVISYYESTIGNGDGELDALEFTKALIDIDQNVNGVWDKAEIMNFYDKAIEAIDLGGITDDNEKQYWDLYGYAVNKTNAYGGADKQFSAEEFRAWLKNSNGISESLANDIINHYDLDGNGQMDALEFTQGLKAVDVNSNGKWDNSEVLNFFDEALPSIDLGNVDDNNITQYWSLYSYAVQNINKYGNGDQNMSAAEMKAWLKDYYAMNDETANQIISHYDLNNDGNMDVLEFTKSLFDLDTNVNGKWDYSEIMNFFDNAITNVDLGGVNEDNIAQYWNLYDYTIGITNQYGGSDKKISADELKTWLENYYAMTDDMANEIINHYGGADGMDALEFADALIKVDTNTNGVWDYSEIMNFFDDAISSANLDEVTADNVKQYWALYAYAVDTINKNGGADKKMSSEEFKTWLVNYYAMTDDMADQIISHYGGADGLDALEFTEALVNIDENSNGVWDNAEIMNFYDNALPAINLGGIDNSNINKYWSLYDAAIDLIKSGDLDKNQKLSAAEYKASLRAQGLPEYLAEGLIARADSNNDNMVDALELTQFYATLDKNNTGVFELDELFNYYKALAASSPGGSSFNFSPNETNISQLSTAYKSLLSFTKSIDANGDNKNQTSEYQNYLLRYGFTEAASMASRAVNSFDKNKDGAIDVFEWMDAVLSFDKNNSGGLDGEEITNYYNFLSS